MTRFRSIAAILGVAALLTVGAMPAAAQTAKKQKKNKAAESAPTAVVGTITKVADDGKTFTVTTFGGNKKQPATTTEFKLTDKTSIEFVAIDNKDLQKLTQGYAVIVGFDPRDKEAATVVKVTRIADAGKKKKKAGS
jgi:FtsP/CotA-like multicopper oxidase with cupredoxin domain